MRVLLLLLALMVVLASSGCTQNDGDGSDEVTTLGFAGRSIIDDG